MPLLVGEIVKVELCRILLFSYDTAAFSDVNITEDRVCCQRLLLGEGGRAVTVYHSGGYHTGCLAPLPSSCLGDEEEPTLRVTSLTVEGGWTFLRT